ncbi:MAG TPA: UTP--glucose-1-phosphate uridylyltransferase [Verrucomicrobiota bacterium]|nr:UTP--glucose-1-phosphate uridylyltransferase [Verrucomicrobiota bacterium]HNU52630.1 UTP--glucose-1-phosphate uridylyltransferase [Verrucomicrobiota bacterium]
MSILVSLITAEDRAVRDQSLDAVCRGATLAELLREAAALEAFRRHSDNLYARVRALFFLYAIHRFHAPRRPELPVKGLIPFRSYEHLLQRRFEEAIAGLLSSQANEGPSDALSSGLAAAYHRLAFQTLADQVRRSVRSVRGNQWMFRMGHPADQPLRIRPEMLDRPGGTGPYPILRERTPVRMDLSHCGWSDIFFLGMDYPEGARVLNVSIDLGVRGRDAETRPPVEVYLRVLDEPILRLTSVDLGATADISELGEVFDFAKDYLGLLKAAVIAAGIVPPGIEGSGQSLEALLHRIVAPARGLEIVSNVNGIPKGSRLAVSTTLLASLIAVCMRATRQASSLIGALEEHERRLVAARAILGEWLGGSGGGWQDSGGVWPGMKLIRGVLAAEGDPEWGVSRGCLLPRHQLLGPETVSEATRRCLQESLVLVHGGMAQNVGPILEMVTEKYLLRGAAEWEGRQAALGILDEILAALRRGDVRAIGAATARNFEGPIQTIIPWASNAYTEALIGRARAEYGDDFWGFWMLGGMSGGGMGFIFDPRRKGCAQDRLGEIMQETKRGLQQALPFAMDPVVYDFSINERGTYADLVPGGEGLMPPGYYGLTVPPMLRRELHTLSPSRRAELDLLAASCRRRPEFGGVVQELFERLIPRARSEAAGGPTLAALLERHGFDLAQHEQIRTDLRSGRIGLAQNRLPAASEIRDVDLEDVVDATGRAAGEAEAVGRELLAGGAVAVVSLAAGAASRWTQGAGVVKALHPFCKLGGQHRTFSEVHLAKSRRVSRRWGAWLPHVLTTSYLTHGPIEEFLARQGNYGYEGPLLLSPGRAVGLRLIPMVRDLHFAWEEMPQQLLDEQAQKVRDSLRAALIQWACRAGEGSDYTDNVPGQCLHPVGHWFEVANLLRNGVLERLWEDRPQLRYLMLHNIDTLGADVDPAVLGLHVQSGACLSFEVIARRIDDRGGGLARVQDRLRLVEGLAMPREEDEFDLSYYNTMTTWIDLEALLRVFGLERADLSNPEKTGAAVRALAARLPTYITLKEVKKRWGHGQEDVFPVAQFEKLWGDMTTLPEVSCRFLVVSRMRGQQLKDPAQLDGWLRDGSAAHVESLCAWR